jgi:SNF2 family DNA or RNA helicase
MRRLELGATLADDMGLGKTLQAIGAIRGRTLVVCPTTLLANWQAEIQRFRPKLSTYVYHGQERVLSDQADVTLTTYALLRRDPQLITDRHWDMAILDEAQAIKNPDSQVAQVAYLLKAGFRLTLTGTPIENRLDELWSQLHFTNPGLLGSRAEFQNRYVEPARSGESSGAASLAKTIAPFVLRRTKQAVLSELPPRIERNLYVDLDEREQAVYQALRATVDQTLLAELAKGGGVIHALEILLRLRQAACHVGLLPNEPATTSSKVELLVEELEEAVADGHKSLVFSQWTSLLDRIEPQLKSVNIGFSRLDGNTKDRGEVVAQFQRADGPPVLLLSLKAGGTGLNLTAADHVFLMDLWWNPAVEQQAADRVHRIGQQRPVFIHRIVAKDTVEERILLLHAKKRALSDMALEEADRATELTREDLLQLLS